MPVIDIAIETAGRLHPRLRERLTRADRAHRRWKRQPDAIAIMIAAGLLAATTITLTLAVSRTLRRRPRPVTPRRGSHLEIVRCPLHGVPHDAELQACRECATQ